MARLRSRRSGVVVVVDDDTPARIAAGFEPVDVPVTAKKAAAKKAAAKPETK